MTAPLVEHLESLSQAVQHSQRLLLCCDFDGTLVPIQDRPEMCSLDPEVRKTFAELLRTDRVSVAIVSGRSLNDLRERIDLDGVDYAGNHGLEIDSRNGSFRHPVALATRPALAEMIQLLRSELLIFPGVWVEDKGLSASVHFRLATQEVVPQVVTRIDQVMTQSNDASEFVVRTGKSVVEIRPSVDWNKGTAVRWLVERSENKANPTLVIYLGDDETDEDAFKEVVGTGIGICVCVRDRFATSAKYTVPEPTSVHQFLKWIATRIRDG